MRIACRRLLQEHGASRLPIYLRPLLRHLGVQVHYVETKERLGHGHANVVYSRSGLAIEIDIRELRLNWRRSRFLIAHELGHILLFRTLRDASLIDSLNENTATYRRVELMCDIAASELLVPTRLLRKALRHTGWEPSGLAYLYRHFDVSRQVLVARLAELLPSGAVFRWRYHARHEGEHRTWRILNVFPFRANEGRPWLPPGCTEKHLSPRVLDDVLQKGAGRYLDRARIELDRRRRMYRGYCTFFPAQRPVSRAGSLKAPGASGTERPDMFLFLADYNLGSMEAFLGNVH